MTRTHPVNNSAIQLARAQKTYNDFLLFERDAIQNLHYSLDEIENTDYFLLMEILGADDSLHGVDVYDDPFQLAKDLGL